VRFGKCLVDSRLIRAQSASALEEPRNALEWRPWQLLVGLCARLCLLRSAKT